MGIPSCRFPDKLHEQFICAICQEVAFDAVVVNNCEHIFCRECIDGSELENCPTCQGQFKYPIWKEMEGLNRRVYLALEVKCLNPSCKQTLDVKTCLDHDIKCPTTFDSCSNCGYKFHHGSSSVHSCSQQVRIDQLERQLVEERKRSIQRLEKKMAAERKRMEKLVMICISFRKSFNDWDCRAGNFSESIKWLKDDNRANNSNNSMTKILEEFNKF